VQSKPGPTRRLVWAALTYAALGGALGAAAWHARTYYPFLSDDALISLRYSRRLLQGHGLSWTGTERVEGYTDLLWVLIHAAMGRLGVDLIASARAFGALGLGAAVVAASIQPRPRWQLRPVRIWCGGAAVACTAPFAVWAVGGLEHGFMAGLLAWAIVLSIRALDGEATAHRPLWLASGLLGALSLLRADGALLAAGVGLGAAITLGLRRRGLSVLARLGSVPAACVLGQLSFRRIYHGSWAPNTAVAKVAFNLVRLRLGLDHVWQGLSAVLVLLLAVLFLLVAAWPRLGRAERMVPLGVFATWCVYLVAMGGDVFPGWRQLLFALVPLVLLAGAAADRLVADARSRWVVPVAALVTLGLHLSRQQADGENLRAKRELWEWDGLPVGRMLERAFADKAPLLAVDAAGALPYWSELPALDMLGINDAYIATHPPPDRRFDLIGHDLGDGDYVWSRRPDLVLYCDANGDRQPCFVSGQQMRRRADYDAVYQLVFADTGQQVQAEMLIRRADGPLGIERSPAGIRVPSYFLASSPAFPARPSPTGSLVKALGPTSPGSIPRFPLPAGTWEVSTEPALEGLAVTFLCSERCPARPEGRSSIVELERAERVTIELTRPQGPEATVEQVVLRRVDWRPHPGL
jgi:arabinofuranosyltransferase